MPHNETSTGVLQQLMRDLVCAEIGVAGAEGTFGELPHLREWRGRKHHITVKFGNIRDRDSMPDAALYATGDVVADRHRLPVRRGRADPAQRPGPDRAAGPRLTHGLLAAALSHRRTDGPRRASWPRSTICSAATGSTRLAADWSQADRQQGKVYLQQRQQQLRQHLVDALKQAYGVAKAASRPTWRLDEIPVLHTLADGLADSADPRGGTLKAAFDNLTARPAGLVLSGHSGPARGREAGHPERAGQGAGVRDRRPPPIRPAASPSTSPTVAPSSGSATTSNSASWPTTATC